MTTPLVEQRMSLTRRVQLGELLAQIDQAEGFSPREIVLVLRALNLCFVKHETDEALLGSVSRPLTACADEIEAWSANGVEAEVQP